jgi:hypothetical protein
MGPNDRRDDFSKGQAWHWKSKRLELQAILFIETRKLKTREVGWPN